MTSSTVVAGSQMVMMDDDNNENDEDEDEDFNFSWVGFPDTWGYI